MASKARSGRQTGAERLPAAPLGFGCGELRGDCRTDRSDAELLAAHVAGDRYAFEELFYRHHRQLYRLAMMTSRNPDDAADALQDALLSAHRTAASFRRDAAVSSWLYRIVVNACLDRLRRNKTHPTTELRTTTAPSAITPRGWTPRSWWNAH